MLDGGALVGALLGGVLLDGAGGGGGGTGARYGIESDRDLLDPAVDIDIGTRYLRDRHEMFDGRIDLMLAAYNAGEGAVRRYGNRIPPYPETQEYVQKIMGLYRDR